LKVLKIFYFQQPLSDSGENAGVRLCLSHSLTQELGMSGSGLGGMGELLFFLL
jgi:hypothetical protein